MSRIANKWQQEQMMHQSNNVTSVDVDVDVEDHHLIKDKVQIRAHYRIYANMLSKKRSKLTSHAKGWSRGEDQ
eukprot:scaffold23394_cov42-Cyclotella_meneghiniana.AAC.10